ncbi:hypothetical protein FSP39_011191, partial [Pinctada imbricata]
FRGRWHGDVSIHHFRNLSPADSADIWNVVTRLHWVRHEHVALFMGVCMDEGNMSIISSFQDGISMHEHIHIKGEKMPLQARVDLIRQVGFGMGYLHSRDIIHRKLNTRNVFLCPNVRISVMDYAITDRKYERDDNVCLYKGELAYIAPEVLSTMNIVPPSLIPCVPFTMESDVFAFGTLVYEFLSGKYPFQQHAPDTIIWLVCSRHRQSLSFRNKTRTLQMLIEKCWAHDPRSRPTFQSINKDLYKKRYTRSYQALYHSGDIYSCKLARTTAAVTKFFTNRVTSTQVNLLVPGLQPQLPSSLPLRTVLFRWMVGPWRDCTQTCGGGFSVEDRKMCTNIPRWHAANRSMANSAPSMRRPGGSRVIIKSARHGTPDSGRRFVVSKWGPCSASCGQGTKWRFVRCKVYLPFSNKDSLTDLADSECSGDKPVESLLCDSEPCYEQYEYRAIGFTACSRSCLGGVQETIVRCVHKENGTVMEDFLCGDKSPPPIARRICNDIICPQRWKVSDFGACSVTCGSGTMIRGVECIQEFASGYQNVIRLPDYMCEQPVPARARICFREECKAEWSVGNWSECTATCGSGITIRDVFCTRVLSLGLTMNVTLKECDLSLKPEATKMCNNRKCPKPKIKALDIKFFQLDKMKKVKLTIGMNADILPDTTIVLKCPTRGLNPYHIQWYKNGVLIQPTIGKRIKVNSKMHLKIKRSLPIVDDGIYSCKVGSLMASSTISYSNVYDIFSATLMRKRFISGSGPAKLIQRDLGLGSLTQRDPVSRRRRPLRLVEGPWNPCSATCGGGLQSRNVSCEIITQDYYEVFPVRYCTKAGYMEPTLIQSCNTHPCVEWKTSNWSECSLQTCVRNMFSYQSRDVDCVMQHSNITLNTSECDQLGAMPPSEKECVNENCMALWNVSKWTECIGKCGTKGFKSRMLNCIWSKTGLPAGRLCDPLKRPITTKNCHVKPCSEACIDKSKYCSVVKLLDFCRLVNFSRNCCVSCGGQSSGDNKYARRKRRKLAV